MGLIIAVVFLMGTYVPVVSVCFTNVSKVSQMFQSYMW